MATLRARFLAIAFAGAAAACLVIAFLERHVTTSNTTGQFIEGAYFNRSVGGSASVAVYSYSGDWFTPFKPLNPYLWVGAALAFLIVSITLALQVRRTRSRTTPTSGG
jgi:hypothetical protein